MAEVFAGFGDMVAAFARPQNGFTVTVDGGALVVAFTGGDSLTLGGSFASAPASLDELENALGGPGAILYGDE